MLASRPKGSSTNSRDAFWKTQVSVLMPCWRSGLRRAGEGLWESMFSGSAPGRFWCTSRCGNQLLERAGLEMGEARLRRRRWHFVWRRDTILLWVQFFLAFWWVMIWELEIGQRGNTKSTEIGWCYHLCSFSLQPGYHCLIRLFSHFITLAKEKST